MKFFVGFLALAMFLSVQGLTEEEGKKMVQINLSCLEETGADLELVNKAREGEFDFDDRKTKQFFLCYFKKFKMMDDDGNFYKAATATITDEEERRVMEEVINPCLYKKGDTMEDIAWNYLKCFRPRMPRNRNEA